jgi:cytochrome c oxidase assembly factor CtaG
VTAALDAGAGAGPGAATATTSILTWHTHVVALVVWLAIGAAYVVLTRRAAWRAGRGQTLRFAAGIVLALLVTAWPLEDLASQRILTALVVQRLVLLLAVAPLLLTGVPDALVASATRPPPVDAAMRQLTRPVIAVVVVTAVSVSTLTAAAVRLQATSAAAAVGFDLLLVAAGVILWAPVLGHLPGTPRLNPLGQAAYLIVQSIVPGFLSIVWIFSRHPLYPVYAHAPRLWGMAHLTDQFVAGFVAKLTTIAVLWTVAFVIVSRASHSGDLEASTELRWADVEREFERADRRRSPFLPPRQPEPDPRVTLTDENDRTPGEGGGG